MRFYIYFALYLFSDRFGDDEAVDRSKYNNSDTFFTVCITAGYEKISALPDEVNVFKRWDFFQQKLLLSQSQPPVYQNW
jgi:hypothetical protein